MGRVLALALAAVVAARGQGAETCPGGGAAGAGGVCAGGWPTEQSVTLWNGVEMPRVGFGTAAMRGAETRKAVREALDAGFRHFDGAEASEWYDDQALGEELRAFVEEGRGTRDELFVVSKVHPKNLGRTNTEAALAKMRATLQVDRLDLVLLHFPECGSWIPTCADVVVEGTWQDSWRALEEAYGRGEVRAIGVSNFDYSQVLELLEFSNVLPHVVQNWMDPFHPDEQVRELCDSNVVAYTSYSTLGGQWEHREPRRNLVKESPVVAEIAKQRNMHWTQVALQWALQRGAIVLPRSTNPAHIRANARLLNSRAPRLTPRELEEIDALSG